MKQLHTYLTTSVLCIAVILSGMFGIQTPVVYAESITNDTSANDNNSEDNATSGNEEASSTEASSDRQDTSDA